MRDERNIKYCIKHSNDEKADIKNNLFLTYLINEGISIKIKNQLFDVVEQERFSFWAEFGYKYMGCLVNEVQNYLKSITEKNIERLFSNLRANFLIRELLCLYFNIENAMIFDEKQSKMRNKIRTELSQGITAFFGKMDSIEDLEKYVCAVEKYLSEGMTKKELISIQQLPVIHIVGEEKKVYPLTRDGNFTMAVVNPWPGDKSAEAEVLNRMQVGAADIGMEYVMLDNFGHILESDTQKATEEYVNPKDLQFVMTTHYESEKTVDSFYYHTLWNPPEIPLNLGDYDTRITNNYIMNDDYLIYDFGGMSNHLKGMLMNKPRSLEGTSSLTASFPLSKILEPKLDNPKLFYCGMNWEKVVSNSNRHEGLFKLLDETGVVKFFGPDKVEAWGGLRPWEGYKCYQYSIPFDGFSILDEINECGVCLVLSSDIHRRAGAATNRTYEACAAGAVIISDDNEFMQHYFKDAALFIEYNKNNPKDTFDQIMDKYHWIVKHKEEALRMAKRAQQIFKERFTLDSQFLDIANNHVNRFRSIEKDLFAKDESGRVLVTYVVDTLDIREAKDKCIKVISNVINQYYSNIILGIVCDQTIEHELAECLKQYTHATVLVSMELFDFKLSKRYTDGQAIRLLQDNIDHDYWINIWAHEIWHYDHVTTLVRAIQDDNSECAYAGRLHKDALGYSRADFFGKMHYSTVFGMNCPDWLPVPGQMLFTKKCHSMVPDYTMDCLDGYEHYMYIGLLWIKNKARISFSKRMTSCWTATNIDERNIILKAEYQIRFIRDLLKYDIPDGVLASNNGLSREGLRQYMMEMPAKSWLKMRWYNSQLKYHAKSSKKKEKLQKKYEKELTKFKSI